MQGWLVWWRTLERVNRRRMCYVWKRMAWMGNWVGNWMGNWMGNRMGNRMCNRMCNWMCNWMGHWMGHWWRTRWRMGENWRWMRRNMCGVVVGESWANWWRM